MTCGWFYRKEDGNGYQQTHFMVWGDFATIIIDISVHDYFSGLFA